MEDVFIALFFQNMAAHRRLLEDYCKQHMDEFEGDAETYADDGFNGTDTNREDFQRLIGDIYAGKKTVLLSQTHTSSPD